jgi:hypothetical protein
MIKGDKRGQRLLAIFALGCILLTYPMLQIFNHGDLFLGVPLLVLYVFLAWLAVIVLTALVIER